jgi:hypothetical protein
MEPRGATDKLYILLRAAVLERQLVLWKRPDHVQKQTPRNDSYARGSLAHLESDAQSELHVGRLKLRPSILDTQENAGERLNRTSGGSAAHGYAKAAEERFTRNGELQLVLPI